MNDNTRNAFASYGLEILKRACCLCYMMRAMKEVSDTLRFENGLTHREHLATGKSQQVIKKPEC